jgi:hypothetical protein
VPNLWNKPDIPHKGWTCSDVFDVRANDEPPDEVNYETCEMCGNERIRFVHLMRHSEGDFHIVVCSEGQNPIHYRLFINERRGQRLYPSENTAKLAAFDAIEKMKQRVK